MEGNIISVIIPIYKVEKYLKKCINSIIGQTYENLDIILVDDGSPDNCGSICDEYSNKDNRIRVIHKKNGGLSDSRNVGLENSVGNYVVFVDSDDYINKNMIKILYDNLIKTDADISICKFKKVYENENVEKKIDSKQLNKEVFNNKEALLNIYNDNNGVYFLVAWNKLYKKSLFDDIKYPVGKIHEDEFVIHYLFNKCNKIVFIDEELYYYMQRNDSIIGKGFNLKSLDALEALEDRYLFLRDSNEISLIEKIIYGICYYNRVCYIEIKKNTEYRNQLILLENTFNNYYQKIMKEKRFQTKIKIKIFIMKYFIFLFKKHLDFKN